MSVANAARSAKVVVIWDGSEWIWHRANALGPALRDPAADHAGDMPAVRATGLVRPARSYRVLSTSAYFAAGPDSGSSVPTVGSEAVRINLWLCNGIAPSEGRDVEVIIRFFQFNP